MKGRRLTLRLGQVGVLFAFVGMVVLVAPSLFNLATETGQSFGLMLLTLGFLVIALSYVMDRLYRLGAEYWAIGSILVYLGFIFILLPLLTLSFLPAINQQLQLSFFLVGVAFVVLGYTTTKYELNERLIKLFATISERVSNGFSKIMIRLRKSPIVLWILVNFIALLGIVLSDFENYIGMALRSFGISISDNLIFWLVLASFSISVAINSRELLIGILSGIGRFALIVAMAIMDWIRNLRPKILMVGSSIFSLLLYLKAQFTMGLRYIGANISDIISNAPYASFAVGALFLSVHFISENEALLILGTFLLILPTTLIMILNPEWIRTRVNRVQAYSYRLGQRTKIRLQKRIRRKECPSCNQPLMDFGESKCISCDSPLEYCSICRDVISPDYSFSRCANCSHPIHNEHLDDWLQLSSICPWCKEIWRKQTSM